MHILLLVRVHLEEFNRALLQILQQDDVIFADLIVHLALKVVVGL